MKTESEIKTQNLKIHTKEGETSRIDWAENTITLIVAELIRGVIECAQNIVKEALRIRVMEGDTAEDIFSYMFAREMIHIASVNKDIDDRVRDAY